MSQENITQSEVALSVKELRRPTYIREEDILQDLRQRVLNSIETPFPVKIKKFDWISSDKCNLMPLVLDFHLYPKGFNCFMIRQKWNMSKNYRVKIRHSSVIDGIYIPCVDPEIDVKSVTLYAATALPKDKRDRLDGDYIFHENRIRKAYVPIKKITNITSNRVTFSDHPIILDRFISYSIEIEYSDEIKRRLSPQLLGVEVESLFFLAEIETHLQKGLLVPRFSFGEGPVYLA